MSSHGAEVRVVRLADLKFNPSLDLTQTQEFEPDMARLQSDLTWAQHIVLVYPTWWGRRQLDEVRFRAGAAERFAFKFHAQGMGWDQLLKGRTCELIVTMDTPPSIYRCCLAPPAIASWPNAPLNFAESNASEQPTLDHFAKPANRNAPPGSQK